MFAAKKRSSGLLLMLAIIMILAACSSGTGSLPPNRHRQREAKRQQPLPDENRHIVRFGQFECYANLQVIKRGC